MAEGTDNSGRWQDELYDLLRGNNITQFAYVPDAGHRILIDRSLADPGVHSVALTTEEEEVALLAGADLGGARGVLLMQSSGAGNCVNMLSLISGRGAGYPAPPPQIPACGFPAPGSCRRSNVIDVRGLGGPFRFDPRIGASCDTPNPALCPGRASASTASSDWVPSLRPLRHRSARLCSRVSPVLWTYPTPRLFPDSFAVSASCRGPGSLLRLRARRGLPGSGASPSCVMWPQTPAGRRGLA